MGRESHALLAGLFVIVLGTALVLAGIWLGDYGNEYDTYLVTTRSTVSGLRPESSVYFRGVEAGKVADIRFDPNDAKTIQVLTQLHKGLPISSLTFARLRVQPLTGLAQIELDNAEGEATPLPTSPDRPAVIPMQPSLLDQLTWASDNLLSELEQLLVNFKALFNEENRARLQRIFENVDAATARLVRLEERLDKALAEAPEFSGQAKRTLSRIDALSTDIQNVARKLGQVSEDAQGLVASGRASADTLAQHTLPRLNAWLYELQSATTQFKRLTDMLANDPQALLLGPTPDSPGPGEPGYRETH